MDYCLAELYFGYNFLDIDLDIKKYTHYQIKPNTILDLIKNIFILLQRDCNKLEQIEKLISEFYLQNKLFHFLSKLQNIPITTYLDILKMMMIQRCRIMFINDDIPLVHDYKEFYLDKWERVREYEFMNKERCFRNMLLFTRRYDEWIKIQFNEFYNLRNQKVFSKRIITHYQNIIHFLIINRKNSVDTEIFIMRNIDLLKYLIINKRFKKHLWFYLYSYNINNSIFYNYITLKFGNELYKEKYGDRNCYPQIYISKEKKFIDRCYICMDDFVEYQYIILCRTCVESVSHLYCSEKFGKCGFCRRQFRLHFSYFRN